MTNPLPYALILLSLALPAVGLGGYEIARRLTEQRSLRAALTPGLALALWLLSVHAAGLATHSFVRGLSIGTLGVALVATAYHLRRRGDLARKAPSLGQGPSRWAALLIVITAAPIAYMAFGWAFHDEYMYTGHMSVSSEIQNNIYPPRHLTFADTNLRYHYGFDLLTACISALTRAPVSVSIDIATVTLWVYTAFLLWVLGDLWFGRGRGWLTMLMTLFSGELPVSLSKKFELGQLAGLGDVKNLWLLPPVVSNFFQHPWGLGLPIAVAALLVFSARDQMHRVPRLCALWLLLSMLSISQVVLFVTVLPSIVAAELWAVCVVERRHLREGLGITAAAALAVITAVVLGGFFTRQGSSGLTTSINIHAGVVEGLGSALLWHAQSYGFALPIALVGVPLLPPRGRVVTGLLLAGSLVVINTFVYVHSWDIVKFGVVAAIAMGLGGSAVVDRILRARPDERLAKRIWRRGIGAALVFAATCGGLLFALSFVLFPKISGKFVAGRIREPEQEDARVASFIRERVRAGEIVYRHEGPAVGYAQWAGLPVPWLDWAVYTFDFPKDRLDARAQLLRHPSPDSGAYLAQGIAWFVLDEKDKEINANADRWLSSGSAVEVLKTKKLRVLKLTP